MSHYDSDVAPFRLDHEVNIGLQTDVQRDLELAKTPRKMRVLDHEHPVEYSNRVASAIRNASEFQLCVHYLVSWLRPEVVAR